MQNGHFGIQDFEDFEDRTQSGILKERTVVLRCHCVLSPSYSSPSEQRGVLLYKLLGEIISLAQPLMSIGCEAKQGHCDARVIIILYDILC